MKKESIIYIILGIILVAIVFFWFYHTNYAIKEFKVFCGQSEDDWLADDPNTTWIESIFKNDMCLNECANFCVELGFKYKDSYPIYDAEKQKGQCNIPYASCGCECI